MMVISAFPETVKIHLTYLWEIRGLPYYSKVFFHIHELTKQNSPSLSFFLVPFPIFFPPFMHRSRQARCSPELYHGSVNF